MPPPPPASMPLTQRLMQLAQTLQFAWFAGHLTLLFCTLRYGLSYLFINYYSKWARFSYRTAFVAAAATYGIVVYKGIRARSRQSGSSRPPQNYLSLVTDENVQYLIMAMVWLLAPQIPLALLPFAVYSVFHVATYARTNLIPTLQPPPAAPAGASPGSGSRAKPSSPLADQIAAFVKRYYDASMTLVAYLEIALWFRVLVSAVAFARGSWILLAVYTVFFRSRYAQSAFVQGAFHDFAAGGDRLAANQSAPEGVRQGWATVKRLVRQATDATDLRKYAGSQPARKAQ